MANSPGLLGMRPSRHFKIFREKEFPAIFRFNGKLFMEYYNIDDDETVWREVQEETAMRYLEAKKEHSE